MTPKAPGSIDVETLTLILDQRDKRMETLEASLLRAIEGVGQRMDGGIRQVHARVGGVLERVERVEANLATVKRRGCDRFEEHAAAPGETPAPATKPISIRIALTKRQAGGAVILLAVAIALIAGRAEAWQFVEKLLGK